jgi:putative sterol carrier protein
MAVRSGDLNPQVAMLADKIKVKGKIGPAVYLFNLIAPRMVQ